MKKFLGTIITVLIVFSIVSCIWEKYRTSIIIAIVFLLIIAIGYAIYHSSTHTGELFSNSKSSNAVIKQEEKNETIKTLMTTLLESAELINTSNILGTVVNRYRMCLNTIDSLSIYSNEEIEATGYKLKQSLADTRHFIQQNKVSIFNQSIERNLTSEIDSLKTSEKKLQKLEILYHNMKTEQLLEPENVSFLKKSYDKLLKEITDSQLKGISQEVFDLLWFGDGIYKNYTPPVKKDPKVDTPQASAVIVVTFPSRTYEEPSAIYMELPVSRATDKIVENPPYYPAYNELSPEQRGKYLDFLSNPFLPQNDVGYAFLYYYGLERHMISQNFDKAFDMIIKLRSCYNNKSFQFYTANAIILTSITRNRTDLIKKLLESSSKNDCSSIPIEYLLLLKYKFNIPLTISEIIKNHRHFGYSNDRYIKIEPKLFYNTLLEFMIRDYQSDSINLNQYFPMDIEALPLEQRRMFANISLENYKAPIQVFDNPVLHEKIQNLLNDTHDLVKSRLRYGNQITLEEIRHTTENRKPIRKKSFKNMSGHDFEKYCAELLSLNGFSSINVTRDSGDQGIDIIAHKGNIKYGIQCKLYSNRVGNSAVQEAYSGKDFYKCQIGAVLTNNYFTESARELATALGVVLWDGDYLQELQQKAR